MISTQELLTCLRTQTKTCHEKIESRFNVFEHLVDLPTYREHLQRLYGFYVSFEKAVEPYKGVFSLCGLDIAERKKLPLLKSDLLGLDLTEDEIARIPVCAPAALPSTSTFAGAVGCLYVIEGSTLGAQIILKHIKSVLGEKLHPRGTHFYTGYGKDTGSQWKKFGRFLQVCPEQFRDAREIDRCTDAAVETFELLGSWLCGTQTADRQATLPRHEEPA